MGVVVALIMFIFLSMILTVVCMVFYQRMETAKQEAAEANTSLREYVHADERERDEYQRLSATARQDGKSVVTHLLGEFKQVMQLTAGGRDLSREDLERQMGVKGVPEGQSLISAYNSEKQRANDAESAGNALQSELDVAAQRWQEESARRTQLVADQQATIDSLNEKVGRFQDRADEYAIGVQTAEDDMDRRVSRIRTDYDGQITSLNSNLEDSQLANARLNDSVKALQKVIDQIRPKPGDEGTIQDGSILQSMENDNVFIDLGRQDMVQLGMRFEVYSDASQTRPDANGVVPMGKGTVEVIRLDESTATARVIRKTPGQAVVDGDILVNPIYDRNKTYAFYVFGMFDLDGEDGPSDLETDSIKGRIQDWGGELRDEFAGDIDFLVLGVEPTQPTPLQPNPTPIQVRRHVAQRQFFQQYSELLDRAGDLSIPVLNQNRLFTLIGYYGP